MCLGELAEHFPAGTRVRITGLITAAHLNGSLETAVQPIMPLTVRWPDRGSDRRPDQDRVAILGQRAPSQVGAMAMGGFFPTPRYTGTPHCSSASLITKQQP